MEIIFFFVCSKLETKHILKEFFCVFLRVLNMSIHFHFIHSFEYEFFSRFEHDSISLFDTNLLLEKKCTKKVVILKKNTLDYEKKCFEIQSTNLNFRLSSCFLWIFEESGFKKECVQHIVYSSFTVRLFFFMKSTFVLLPIAKYDELVQICAESDYNFSWPKSLKINNSKAYISWKVKFNLKFQLRRIDSVFPLPISHSNNFVYI